MPDIRHRDGEKLRERALAINPYSFGIRAKMPPAGETIATVSANDVTFAGDQIAGREASDPGTDAFDHADVLVADHHRNRDCDHASQL